jgi:hypothetical protein
MALAAVFMFSSGFVAIEKQSNHEFLPCTYTIRTNYMDSDGEMHYYETTYTTDADDIWDCRDKMLSHIAFLNELSRALIRGYLDNFYSNVISV